MSRVHAAARRGCLGCSRQPRKQRGQLLVGPGGSGTRRGSPFPPVARQPRLAGRSPCPALPRCSCRHDKCLPCEMVLCGTPCDHPCPRRCPSLAAQEPESALLGLGTKVGKEGNRETQLFGLKPWQKHDYTLKRCPMRVGGWGTPSRQGLPAKPMQPHRNSRSNRTVPTLTR